MGCDIHCYVEKKINGKWEQIKGFVSDYYDPKNEYFSSEEYLSADSPIDCRNYSLFSYLAGVRSSGKKVVCLSEPKGLPEDVSNNIKAKYEEWSCDAHSSSYLNVQELYSGLDREIHYEGVVGLNQYKEYVENGEPSSWSASVGGGRVSVCTNAGMDNYLKWGRYGEDSYTVVKWSKCVKDALSDFVEHSLQQLTDRCDSKELDDVRIVFWFDN